MTLKWYNWKDVPFEEYIQNEHNVLPGVLVYRKDEQPHDYHHIKEIGGGDRLVREHLIRVCESYGEGKYYIIPAEWPRGSPYRGISEPILQCHHIGYGDVTERPDYCERLTMTDNELEECTCCSQCCGCGG